MNSVKLAAKNNSYTQLDDCQQAGCGQRGRPRDRGKNVAILEAASNLFLERGFDATSMDEVARCACVSKQTVYSHFEGKSALFAAAVRAKIDAHSPRDAVANVEQHTLKSDLRAVCVMYGRLLLGSDAIDMYRLLVGSAQKGSDLSQQFWDAGPAIMLEELTSFLREYVDRGELVVDDLEFAASQLIALLKGRLHFKMSIGLLDAYSDDEFERHIDGCLNMFLKTYEAG